MFITFVAGSTQHEGQLTIPNIRPEHSGTYVCTVALDTGDDVKKAASVRVVDSADSNGTVYTTVVSSFTIIHNFNCMIACSEFAFKLTRARLRTVSKRVIDVFIYENVRRLANA